MNLNALSQARPLNLLSLFSGCGGMDLGFEGGFAVLRDSIDPRRNPGWVEREIDQKYVLLKKNRFHTVFANDILPEARTAWSHYFGRRGHPPHTFRPESIVDLVKAHKAGETVFPEQVDIVTGGFPCQDFSVAGKRGGFDSHKDHRGRLLEADAPSTETRGQLYMWMKEVVEITRPKIFIAENVKGLVNLANVKEIIQHDFAKAAGNGYIVLDPKVLHAADYGVPQSRERVFFIGIQKAALRPEAARALEASPLDPKFDPYPRPTHAYKARRDDLLPFVSLRRLFAGLEEPEHSHDLTHRHYSKAKYMGAHCQGQSEVKLEGVGPTIRAEHHGNIEFRRLAPEHGGHALDADAERRLTPRECALIQTFPPDYDFVLPHSQPGGRGFALSPSGAYKVIGNAVPPLLAFHLANRIEELWDVLFEKK